MLLKVIASGSSGNCYALISENEILLLDVGVPTMEIKKGVDFRIADIVGCIVSHQHG